MFEGEEKDGDGPEGVAHFGKSDGGGGGGGGGASSSIMPGAARDSIEAAEAFRQEFGKVQRDFRASLELQGKLLGKVRACECSGE